MSESGVNSRSSSPDKKTGSRGGKGSDSESSTGGTVKRNRKLKVAPKNATEIFEKKQAVAEGPTRYKKVKFGKIKLHFMMNDGTFKDQLLENRDISTYLQLQQEICKIFPHSKSMFMVQKTDGKMLNAENFQEVQVYNIREIYSSRLSSMKFIPHENAYWEFKDYHAAPKNWRMPKPRAKKPHKPEPSVSDLSAGSGIGLDGEPVVKSAMSIFSKKEPV